MTWTLRMERALLSRYRRAGDPRCRLAVRLHYALQYLWERRAR